MTWTMNLFLSCFPSPSRLIPSPATFFVEKLLNPDTLEEGKEEWKESTSILSAKNHRRNFTWVTPFNFQINSRRQIFMSPSYQWVRAVQSCPVSHYGRARVFIQRKCPQWWNFRLCNETVERAFGAGRPSQITHNHAQAAMPLLMFWARAGLVWARGRPSAPLG